MDPDDLVQASDLAAFSRGERHAPHALLGAHPAEIGGQQGVIVRAYHPDAAGCGLVRDGVATESMLPLGDGVFAVFLRVPLDNPPAFVPNTGMPNVGLRLEEARDIAAFLSTLERARAW